MTSGSSTPPVPMFNCFTDFIESGVRWTDPFLFTDIFFMGCNNMKFNYKGECERARDQWEDLKMNINGS